MLVGRIDELTQLRAENVEMYAFHQWTWHGAEFGTNTLAEWRTWLEGRVLGREDFDAVLNLWWANWLQQDCVDPMRTNIMNLMGENTRQSKGRARQLIRSTLKTHVRNTYGNYAVTIRFLELSTPGVTTLLQHWQQFKTTEEYQKRQEDSKPRRRGADTPAKRGGSKSENAQGAARTRPITDTDSGSPVVRAYDRVLSPYVRA